MISRYYIAPQIGNGTTIEDPIRSIFHDYIDTNKGEAFDEIQYPVRRISLCCVTAEPLTHATIEALPVVTQVVPSTKTLNDIVGLDILSVQQLLKLGIPLEDISATSTWKDVITRICHACFTAQRNRKTKVAVLTAELDKDPAKLAEMDALLNKTETLKFAGETHGTASVR